MVDRRCETAALVGRNGSIDWLCWPDLRFRRLFWQRFLAPRARPLVDRAGGRDYRHLAPLWDNTLILETRFETADGGST